MPDDHGASAPCTSAPGSQHGEPAPALSTCRAAFAGAPGRALKRTTVGRLKASNLTSLPIASWETPGKQSGTCTRARCTHILRGFREQPADAWALCSGSAEFVSLLAEWVGGQAQHASAAAAALHGLLSDAEAAACLSLHSSDLKEQLASGLHAAAANSNTLVRLAVAE